MLATLTEISDPRPAQACFGAASPRLGRSKRVLELAPGVWIVRFKQWQPAAVLDTNSELPLRVELPEVTKRILPFVEWHERARCRGMGEETFFGADPDERPTLKLSELARARAICAQCSVARECLQWALSKPEKFGVWGGTSGRQRDRMWLLIEAGYDPDTIIDTWLNR
jgi:WhiB family redox-sensing transcriptional regulator